MERSARKFSQAEHSILLMLLSPGVWKSRNEPVDGKTRLMKLIFLLDRESESSYPLLHIRSFKPHYYGPFSPDVSAALDSLLSYEYVFVRKVTTSSDRDLPIFSLTDRGVTVAEDSWRKLPTDAKRDIFSIKNAYNGMSMTQLLHYVYSTYPEYTTRSKLVNRESAYDA